MCRLPWPLRALGIAWLLLGSCKRRELPGPPSAAQEKGPSGLTIEGRVVDEHGTPVANVSVHGLLLDMAVTPRAQTLDDGSFVLPTPTPRPYFVRIEAEDPPEPSKNGKELHSPGERGVELVLKDVQRTTFLVLDDASGAPIERYGLAVADGPEHGIHGGYDMQAIPLCEHPRGIVITHARTERHVVRVEAPGHAPIETTVVFDADHPKQQTIRLGPGGSVTGHVVYAGKPLAQARVAILRAPSGTVWPEMDDHVEPDSWFFMDCPRDLGDFVGRPRERPSDTNGVFRFDDLAAGTYEVGLEAPGLGPRRVKQVRVELGTTRDLGAIELGAPASLQVRVILPLGGRAEDLRCAFDGDWRGRKPIPSADGMLRYEGLGPGLHRVVLTGSRTLLPNDEKRDVRLASGETREVVFDLTASAPR